MRGEVQAPAALPQGNRPQYPLDRGLSGPETRSGLCGKETNLTSAGFRTPGVQPVVRRYTDYTILTGTWEGQVE
jgi:hypothetical protein